MSTHFEIDVSTVNLKLKLGSISYITNTEKDHISILAKHPNDDEHELYFLFSTIYSRK